MAVSIRFREEPHQLFHHDLRIFVAGADVSASIRDRVNVSLADRESPNTCSFTLDNALDKFIFTEHNANNLYGTDPFERYSERAKSVIVRRKLKIDGKIDFSDRDTAIDEVSDVFWKNLNDELDRGNIKPTKKDTEKLVREIVTNLSDAFFSVDGNGKDDPARIADTRRSVIESIVKRMPSVDPVAISQQTDRVLAARAGGAFFNDANIQTENLEAPVTPKAGKVPVNPETGYGAYSFSPGDLVINKHDPVLVFAKNPLNGRDEWYRAFTGFINTVTLNEDCTTGESSISINCYCIRALMRRMRVSTNDGYAVIKPGIYYDKENNSPFQDILRPGAEGRTNVGQGLSLEQQVEFYVTGQATLATAQQGDPVMSKDSKFKSVGRFSLGEVVEYPSSESGSEQKAGIPKVGGNEADNNIMAEWHSLSVFGSNQQTKAHSIYCGKMLDSIEVDIIGANSYVGGVEDPWNRKLHMLLPRTGTQIRQLLTTAFDNNPSEYAMSTRWDAILYAVRELDYQFFTSPTGDLLLEFPVYDFAPGDYGTPYSHLFTYFGHLISNSITDEGAEMPSGTVVTGNLSVNSGSEDETTRSILRRATSVSRDVFYRYGAGQIDMIDKPYLTKIGDISAYSIVAYQKSLMNASSIDFTAVHRPFILPNRPILNVRRNRLGVSQSVEHIWSINEDVSTSIVMSGIRKRVVESDGTAAYRSVLSGGASLVLSYRLPRKVTAEKTAVPSASSIDFSSKEAKASPKDTVIVVEDANTGIVTLTEERALTGSVEKAQEIYTKPENVAYAASQNSVDKLQSEAKAVLRSIADCVKPTKLVITDAHRTEGQQKAIAAKTDETSDNTKHFSGDAFDIRLKQKGNPPVLSRDEVKKIAKCANDAGYNCIVHMGTAPHVHIEKPTDGKKAFFLDKLGYTDGKEVKDKES